MQFHMTKIQLHHPFAFHAPQPLPQNGQNGLAAQLTMGRIATRCQTVGTASAIRMAKLFATFRQKYDIRHLQCSGTQYAAIATRFLVKSIPLLRPDEVVEPEAHLRSLTRTLEDMSRTFKPAVKPLEEARDALKSLEKRTSIGPPASTPFREPPLVGRSYSVSSTRPALDNLELASTVLFPASSGLDLFEDGDLDADLTISRSADSCAFSLESGGGSAPERTSVDGFETIFLNNRGTTGH